MNTPSAISLMPGERVLFQCHTHWKNWMLPFTGAFLAVLGLCVRVHFYGAPLIINFKQSFGVSLDYRLVSFIETAALLFLAASLFLRGFHQLCARYIITDQRLIHHAGLLNTRTTELRLLYCSNLSMYRNLPGMLLGYGDFGLRAGGVDMFFNDVPDPKAFHRRLTDAIARAWSQEAGAGAETPGDYRSAEWLERELNLRP